MIKPQEKTHPEEPNTPIQKVNEIERFIAGWPWHLMKTEIERMRAEAVKESENFALPHPARDAAIGRKMAFDKILAYPDSFRRAREADHAALKKK